MSETSYDERHIQDYSYVQFPLTLAFLKKVHISIRSNLSTSTKKLQIHSHQ